MLLYSEVDRDFRTLLIWKKNLWHLKKSKSCKFYYNFWQIMKQVRLRQMALIVSRDNSTIIHQFWHKFYDTIQSMFVVTVGRFFDFTHSIPVQTKQKQQQLINTCKWTSSLIRINAFANRKNGGFAFKENRFFIP